MANFDQAFADVIGVEGGYVDNPNDPGGATKFGITIHTLSRWLGKQVSKEDVKNLSLEEAKAIYFNWYWRSVGIDQIKNDMLANLLFDQSVNRGPATAIRMLEAVLGIPSDGRLSADEIRRINSLDGKELSFKLIEEVMRGYARIVKHPFILGWTNRALKLLEKWKKEA